MTEEILGDGIYKDKSGLWLPERYKTELLGTLHGKNSAYTNLNAKHCFADLFNKPNMTERDKYNMKKVISQIEMLVEENRYDIKQLESLFEIEYGSNYIKIADIKYAREFVKIDMGGVWKKDGIFYYDFFLRKKIKDRLPIYKKRFSTQNDTKHILDLLPRKGDNRSGDSVTNHEPILGLLNIILNSGNNEGYIECTNITEIRQKIYEKSRKIPQKKFIFNGGEKTYDETRLPSLGHEYREYDDNDYNAYPIRAIYVD